jgi:hypothetical protein
MLMSDMGAARKYYDLEVEILPQLLAYFVK